MATDPQTLILAGACYSCDLSQYPILKLGLLRQILLALNPGAVTDPQTLINQGACYNCYLPQYPLMELALLAQIAANGGGSGPGTICLISGVGPPVGVAPCPASLYYTNEPNPGVWVWDGANWQEIIAPGP